jgi:gluconate 2-dehydrogenase gamma chain
MAVLHGARSLIPADELGPGAREAGVACFIDRELAGAFGAGARTYRQGPWAEGTPEQGFQLPLSPKQIYRASIAETDAHCRARYGKGFEDLDVPQREEVLKGLESGAIALASVPARLFFGMLWANTREGFLADPLYGGNRDKAGWKLVGFPGVAAAYADEIQKHNVPYRVVPVSIADIERGHAPVDAHGHAVHTRLDRQS